MHARVHTSGAQAAKSSIAGRRGRQGIGGIQPPLSSAPRLQAGRGVVSLGRTTPTHAEQQGGAGGRDPQALARQRRGRAYRSKDAPPRLPQRSRASSAERSASRPHGRAQRPRGREPGAQQASSKPAAPLGASEARRAGASTSPAGARLPRAAGAGGDKERRPQAARLPRVPNSACAILLD